MGGAGRGRAERVHPAGAIHLARAGPPVRQRSVRSRAAWSAARFQARGANGSPTPFANVSWPRCCPWEIAIPGTKRVSRVEENTAADGVVLSTEQIDKLNNLAPAAGDHHEEAQMRMIGR